MLAAFESRKEVEFHRLFYNNVDRVFRKCRSHLEVLYRAQTNRLTAIDSTNQQRRVAAAQTHNNLKVGQFLARVEAESLVEAVEVVVVKALV